MSIVWEYRPNGGGAQFFCLHCNNLTETAFFHSDFEVEGDDDMEKIGDGHIICMRCARVLSKLYDRVRTV